MAHILGNCCIRYQCAFLLYLSLVKSLFCFPTLQRGNKIGLLTVTSSNHMSTPSLQLLVFFYSSPPFCLFCVSASLVSNMSAVMRSEDSGEQRIVPTETLGENRQAMISAVHTHTQTAVFNENFSATDVWLPSPCEEKQHQIDRMPSSLILQTL